MPDMKPAPVKPTVSKADLERIDIRVGTIRSVEDVPRSEKLVRLVAQLLTQAGVRVPVDLDDLYAIKPYANWASFSG